MDGLEVAELAPIPCAGYWCLEGPHEATSRNHQASVTVHGKPALIAAKIKKGNEILRLRDESGVPAWSGWRKGS